VVRYTIIIANKQTILASSIHCFFSLEIVELEGLMFPSIFSYMEFINKVLQSTWREIIFSPQAPISALGDLGIKKITKPMISYTEEI
jgi:hypothetical protein